MKTNTIFLLIILSFFASLCFSQETKIEEFSLENGLRVYLNENPLSTNVFGAVVIKTGAKYDNPKHTGTAHYLEHMLFKGTETLGTTDYNAENEILSQIELKYEELYLTSIKKERDTILEEIKKLSQLAGQFAIPNELDKLLNQIGSSMVNAFTTEEAVAYFNAFPANQLEKWISLYSHRFKNPVFRLFQSELETVFEEKNMHADNMITTVIEEFYKSFYKTHPYGTQTILGSNKHIKNPSLRNMKEMFEAYYIPNNMALILCGNFKIEEAKPLIEEYFSSWKKGEIPEFKVEKEKDFQGREKVSKRLTPIKGGIIGFRTVPNNHKDRHVLEVCQSLLNNSSQTGILDKLSIDNKLTAAFSHNDLKNDYGSTIIAFVPKILGQSLKKAEKVILDEIKKLKTGDFDSLLLEATKLSLIKDFNESLESNDRIALLIGTAFISGIDLEEVLNYPFYISEINKHDVKEISEKYFTSNYLAFYSKMGFPSKDYIDEAGYEPIIPKNTETKSEFAKYFETIESSKEEIDFNYHENLVKIHEIVEGIKLYSTKNNLNDIFNLSLKYKIGTLNDSRYSEMCEYFKLVGNKSLNFVEFNKRLQAYGSSFDLYTDQNYLTIEITGFDKYFVETLDLISKQIHSPINDKSKIKNIARTNSLIRRYEKRSTQDISDALFLFALHRDKSPYLTRTKIKEIKKLKPEELIDLLNTGINENLSVHFSGNTSIDTIKKYLSKDFISNNKTEPADFPRILDRNEYKENTIFFLNDSKASQSNINIYINGSKDKSKEKIISNAFNNYFGIGMTSFVFQEIREFRSLAYTAYAKYIKGYTPNSLGYFNAYIGTQCDKTIEALDVLNNLIDNMPINENRLENVKTALQNRLTSLRPNFREISETVEQWKYMGYKENPESEIIDTYKNLNIDEIEDFYKKNIVNKPKIITIVGNKKKINMAELAKFGKIIIVKKNQIIN